MQQAAAAAAATPAAGAGTAGRPTNPFHPAPLAVGGPPAATPSRPTSDGRRSSTCQQAAAPRCENLRPSIPSPPSPSPPSPPSPSSPSSPSPAPPSPTRTPSPPESECGRPGGRADDYVFPTAPDAPSPSPSPSPPAHAPPNVRLPRLSQQPRYPGHASLRPQSLAEALPCPRPTETRPGRRFLFPRASRAAVSAASRRPRQLSSARLWNPTNSTPRDAPPRKRRPSTSPEPSVPLQHPLLDQAADDPAAGDYPLLTLPQLRQTKHPATTRASLQVQRSGTNDHRVSLPSSLRPSYDDSRSRAPTPARQLDGREATSDGRPLQLALAGPEPAKGAKGKAPATAMAPDGEDPSQAFAVDLERGPSVLDARPSNASAADAIGPALSSSDSSIMGEDVQPDVGEEWGPQHPCYPHLNPHVPVDSFEYATTRIIRIRRDWLLHGDLAPTFSNLYPEILDPAGMSEQEFRRIIEKLNGELVPIFDPYSFCNIVDGLLGLATGWLWDDLGLTAIKSRLDALERWIEQWNQEMEKTMASEEGVITPKIIPLRQTAYMVLDIQIPDPEIAPAPSSAGGGESRTALPMEPAAAAIPA